MKFCQNCGQEIAEGANYCPHCSGSLSAVSQKNSPNSKSIHCPECGSHQLSAVVETSTTGGSAVHTPITSRVGSSTYTTSNTHRNYWMCHQCGHQFRNLQNLKEEITRETKRMKLALIMFIVCAIAGIMALSDEVMRFFAGFAGICLLVLAVIFFVLWLSTKKKVSDMNSEREYLEKHCFD